jgi:tRNA uridine 5-carboxymethylaminomethyl modification enzyme
MIMSKEYDCIVIGGGHASCEAALAASRMGCRTLMINLAFETIGEMSCNPAIGGVGKGQLVREIDALGGAMGLVADQSAIQFRQLNASKGQAVRSSRCQSDRKLYRQCMQRVIQAQAGLDFVEDKAVRLLAKAQTIAGVETEHNGKYYAPTVIVGAGTFLNGKIHVGPRITPGGRIGEPSSDRLADSLRALGFDILFFKTGTPPRLDGTTIDFSRMVPQYSDETPVPFSYRTQRIPPDQKLLPCYITSTDEKVHAIIEANMHLSPMYSGQIDATGVRYCPSIEDKLKKFSSKNSHQIFLEPDGLDTNVYYPNGISTGLPESVQEAFVHQIKGLEKVRILKYGYSIEHGIIYPTELKPTLETKKIQGLFLAGQINGSTGYEEAAGQGIMAGINAALRVQGQPPFVLGRDEAYIGVLIDDLVTKGTQEPYRMFTSRVEYRLIVREDNADERLSSYARELGLIGAERHASVQAKYEKIDQTMDWLRKTKVSPTAQVNSRLTELGSAALQHTVPLSDLLKRPEMTYGVLSRFVEDVPVLSADLIAQIEYRIKYEGFISRQLKDIERFKHIENIKIPASIDYDTIPSLSKEICQKLKAFSPANLGQANRISGVTPASISVLMIYIRKLKKTGKA